MNNRRIMMGISSWLLLLAAAAVAVQSQFASQQSGFTDVAGGIGRWISGTPEEYLAVSAVDIVLAPGDPIFLRSADGTWLQVGRIRNNFVPVSWTVIAGVRRPIYEAYTKRATVVLYDDQVQQHFPDGFMLEYHTTPTTLDWVVSTLLTPERQQEISRIIVTDWEKHRSEILEKLQPVVESSIERTVRAIEAELPQVLSNHQADFAKLADRYQAEIIRAQIVPLVRQEILPIVQEEIRPLATELGKELWERVSLWSFTWRYLYDVSPLPEKNAVKLEFDRFMKEEVTPALASRSERFVKVTEQILKRVSANPRVRSVIRENLKKVATDAELQTIVWEVVQEAVVNNQSLKASLNDYWKSAEVQETMALASKNFEPTARAVGDALIGSRDLGITPEFSRVLRAQILMKDRRWFVLVPASHDKTPQPRPEAEGLRMYVASESMPFPLEFEGEVQSPLSQIHDAAAGDSTPP